MSREREIGSQAMALDILARLETFGITKSEKYDTMFDALDAIIAIAERLRDESNECKRK